MASNLIVYWASLYVNVMEYKRAIIGSTFSDSLHCYHGHISRATWIYIPTTTSSRSWPLYIVLSSILFRWTTPCHYKITWFQRFEARCLSNCEVLGGHDIAMFHSPDLVIILSELFDSTSVYSLLQLQMLSSKVSSGFGEVVAYLCQTAEIEVSECR